MPNSLQRWLDFTWARLKEDIRLSIAEKIINYYGYRLRVKHVPVGPRLATPRKVQTRFPQAKTLQFLDEFLAEYGYSLPEFAKKLGHVPSAIYHWFEVDDLQVSKLYKIARAHNLHLIFEIVPASLPLVKNEPSVIFRTSIRIEAPITAELVRRKWDKD